MYFGDGDAFEDILVYQSMVCLCSLGGDNCLLYAQEFNFIYIGSLKIRFMTDTLSLTPEQMI